MTAAAFLGTDEAASSASLCIPLCGWQLIAGGRCLHTRAGVGQRGRAGSLCTSRWVRVSRGSFNQVQGAPQPPANPFLSMLGAAIPLHRKLGVVPKENTENNIWVVPKGFPKPPAGLTSCWKRALGTVAFLLQTCASLPLL